MSSCSSSSSSVTSAIEHYKRKLEKYASSSDPATVLHCLNKLDRLSSQLSINVLQETGIGRSVNALKKHENDEIGRKAKEVVQKWKEMVANEEENEEHEQEEQEQHHEEMEEEQERQEPHEDEEYHNGGGMHHEEEEPPVQEEVEPVPAEEPEPLPEPEVQRSPPSSSSSSSKKSHKHSKKSKRKREDLDEAPPPPPPAADQADESGSAHKKKKSRKDKERDRESSSSSSHHKKSSSSSNGSSSSKDHHRDKDRKSSSSSSRSKSSSSSKSGSSSSGAVVTSTSDAFDNALNGLEAFSAKITNSKKDKESSSRRSSSSSTSNGVKSGSSSSTSFVPPSPSSSSSAGIVPTDLISPNYKPLPRKVETGLVINGGTSGPNSTKKQAPLDDGELSSLIMRNKGGRMSKVYSGTKRTGYFGEVPSLFNMCTHILQEHVDDIEECGGLPYSVLEPILSRATPPTLMKIEEHNPYLMEDTGPLWERFIKKKFPKAKREEFEAYREMYERCMREQEDKLAMLKMKVKDSYNREVSSHKKAKLAYVGGVAKAPRNIRAAQAKNGTALPINEGYKSKITGNPLRPVPMPSSSSGAGSSGRGGINQIKPRVAPMMAKTLKMVRGMKSGFRR